MIFSVGWQAARQLSTADLKLLVTAKEKADAEDAARPAPEAEAAGERLRKYALEFSSRP